VKSEDEFTVESDKQIRFGLIAIRGIGEAIVNNFVAQRIYYNNTYEFFRTVDPTLLNSGTIASLVKSGALDELIPEPEGRMTASEKREFLFDERHSLGVYVTQHPLDDVIHALAPMCDSAVEDLHKQPENGIVKIGGIITQVQKKTTKRGGNMYIMELEDLTGAIEIVLFPKLFEQWEGRFAVGDIVIMEGRLGRDTKEDEESGHTELIHKLYFNNMITPALPENSEQPIILPLYTKPTYDMLVTMDGLLDKNPGNSEVYIEFPEDDKTVTVKFRKTADYGIREDLNTLGFTNV
jgi:DNA polymerase-3 subunit alpha